MSGGVAILLNFLASFFQLLLGIRPGKKGNNGPRHGVVVVTCGIPDQLRCHPVRPLARHLRCPSSNVRHALGEMEFGMMTVRLL